jgi:ubiquinone/menaquinone biosynthesis C-methylase UbiE
VSEWSYDRIADFYDDDMGYNMKLNDLFGYMNLLPSPPADILEVGCGTGRLTLPLLRAGYQICAIDRSMPMLKKLQDKISADESRLQVIHMDARQMHLRHRFAGILFAYCGFQYLIDSDEMDSFFEAIQRMLDCGGVLILDAFLHRENTVTNVWQWDYRRRMVGGCILERWKRIELCDDGTNRVERRYILNDRKKDAICTVSRQRLYTPEQLCILVQNYGFHIISQLYDYQWPAAVNPTPRFYTIAACLNAKESPGRMGN